MIYLEKYLVVLVGVSDTVARKDAENNRRQVPQSRNYGRRTEV